MNSETGESFFPMYAISTPMHIDKTLQKREMNSTKAPLLALPFVP